MTPHKTYAEKLRDPRWQKRRLERLQASGWKCSECEAREEELHVHHRYYVSGREPWEYPDYALRVLCHDCHQIRHEEIPMAMREWEILLEEICGKDGDAFDVEWLAYQIHETRGFGYTKRGIYQTFLLALQDGEMLKRGHKIVEDRDAALLLAQQSSAGKPVEF